ncbi:division plane positioning ATPase MipZ [Klebsiella michiganensis]|nr:AAA family ATPase [Klebsiella michiganensis]
MITIIGSNKGGGGKSTTAINVAVGLALRNHDVCLVDADKQRSAAQWMAEREESGMHTTGLTLIEKRGDISQTLLSLADKFAHIIVDVSGQNSPELISGATVADVIIAPHQSSQFDLNTMIELNQQVSRIRMVNPELKVLVYQSMGSTHPRVSVKEREAFLSYIAELPELTALESVGFFRNVYRDVIPEGLSVLESSNQTAKAEINALLDEVYP